MQRLNAVFFYCRITHRKTARVLNINFVLSSSSKAAATERKEDDTMMPKILLHALWPHVVEDRSKSYFAGISATESIDPLDTQHVILQFPDGFAVPGYFQLIFAFSFL